MTKIYIQNYGRHMNWWCVIIRNSHGDFRLEAGDTHQPALEKSLKEEFPDAQIFYDKTQFELVNSLPIPNLDRAQCDTLCEIAREYEPKWWR